MNYFLGKLGVKPFESTCFGLSLSAIINERTAYWWFCWGCFGLRGGLFRWTIWTVVNIFRDYMREPSLGLWADLWRAILPRSQQRESRTLFCQFHQVPPCCFTFCSFFCTYLIYSLMVMRKILPFPAFWGRVENASVNELGFYLTYWSTDYQMSWVWKILKHIRNLFVWLTCFSA